jgi:uncharacterized protein (DUF1800 family)
VRVSRRIAIGLAATCLLVPVVIWAQGAAGAGGAPRRTSSKSKKLKAGLVAPLTPRERVVQLLDRFTFGLTPGEVDQVLAEGEDKWLDAQMDPAAIPDAALQQRLAKYPTLAMSAAQMSLAFPDRGQIKAVADGVEQYPDDPLLRSVYEVQVEKLKAQQETKAADGKVQPQAERTDAEKVAQSRRDRDAAERVAGELFALPKDERMAALVKMPVDDRIAFTAPGNLSAEQRNLFLNDCTPREAEALRAMGGRVDTARNIAEELQQGRVLRDILSERQLQAVMTNFWFNHFNVYIRKNSDQWYTTSFERDVIAKNALGNFHTLLLATAESPAMMVYLDNVQSIGPDSVANGLAANRTNAKKGSRGLNENYGREVMELHTLGVNGGYTQKDVTALAAILTGWGVDDPRTGGGFAFNARKHEPGPKVWLGYVINDDGSVTKEPTGAGNDGPGYGPSGSAASADSIKQGIAALNLLASSPETAHFISYLLAQYFVADNPPASLVDRLQQSYLASDGDIKTVLRALIVSPEFNSRQYYRNKVKTPEEFVASAFRATGTDPENPAALVNTIRTMGMPLYEAVPPTGYYLTAEQWMNSGALVDRLNFAYQLTMGKLPNQRFDAPKLLATGLLETSPTDAAVARGTNGETTALQVMERTILDGAESPKTNELIEKQLQAQSAGTDAEQRLAVMTALVMGSPEFQVR